MQLCYKLHQKKMFNKLHQKKTSKTLHVKTMHVKTFAVSYVQKECVSEQGKEENETEEDGIYSIYVARALAEHIFGSIHKDVEGGNLFATPPSPLSHAHASIGFSF